MQLTNQKTISYKLLIIGTVTLATIFTASSAAHAQVVGESAPSGTYGSSSQSDFQNAGFQQSGASAATTAGGASGVLKQVNTNPLTVTGAAPTSQSADTIKSKSYVWPIIITGVVAVLALTVLGWRKLTKKQAKQEQIFEEIVIAEAVATKEPKDIPTSPELPKASQPKKVKKPKKKNKKHRR